MSKIAPKVSLLSFILVIVVIPGLLFADEGEHQRSREVHDYIIVGGGTAGLTLGYLLDRDGLDVVVLEAGDDRDDDPNIQNPKAIGALESQWRNEYFWTADGKPQGNLPNDDTHYSGGRVLGGTSSVNDSIYWRGMQRVYDEWGGLFANPKYVQDVFVASETYHGTSQNPAQRGKNGPFDITQVYSTGIAQKWTTAMQTIYKEIYDIDLPVVSDLHTVNGPALSPHAQLWLDPVSQTRVSSSSGLLKKRNSNLDMRLKATVTKVEFKHTKATQVRYIQDGVAKTMRARKKIILSAGIHSAKLLQLSGIGAAAELHAAGVSVVFDNPQVGKNLTNHLLVTFVARVNPGDNQDIATNLAFKQLGGMGAAPDPNTDDKMERHFEFGTVNPAPGISAFAVILTKPESRGKQKIVSSDPLAPLVVDFRYLSVEVDRQRLVTGLEIMKRTVEKIAESDPAYVILSDLSNLAEYVTINATHIHHFSGTCAIGTVVDEYLSVIGVENLMVADMSVSPTTVRGHTHAAAVLIGAAAYTEITGNRDVKF